MHKGILKVSRTYKGRIFVEIDRQDEKPPMSLSYIVLTDLSHNGKECEYTLNESGQVIKIEIELELGREVIYTVGDFVYNPEYFIPTSGVIKAFARPEEKMPLSAYICAEFHDGLYVPSQNGIPYWKNEAFFQIFTECCPPHEGPYIRLHEEFKFEGSYLHHKKILESYKEVEIDLSKLKILPPTRSVFPITQ